VLVFDFLLLGSLVASEGKLNPELLPWSLMLNPTDIYRLLNILAFGEGRQLSGVLSLGSDLPIGQGGLWLLRCCVAALVCAAANGGLGTISQSSHLAASAFAGALGVARAFFYNGVVVNEH
jgi:hypothetical protein